MEQLLLIAWRQAESDARKAEQAAALPGLRPGVLHSEARRLRDEADRQFAELVAARGADGPAPQ